MRPNSVRAARLLCFGVLTSLAACAAAPVPGTSDPLAYDPTAQIMEGDAFRHVLIRGTTQDGVTLHVYIEGDGVPYTSYGTVSRDPTSRSMLMLELMRLDHTSSIYVGRPCYMGLYADRNCSPHYWTDRRFSVEVIDSIHSVIAKEIARTGARRAILIGHSGGGALAVLLAHRIAEVSGVLTVGGNLDTRAWSGLHGYAPLTGSMNPFDLGPLPANVKALHLVGAKDRVTPPDLVRSAAATIGGDVIVVSDFTHVCCWGRIWPEPLLQLN